MKCKILTNYNYVIAFLLSLLGVGGACTMGGCEYGSPAEEYGTPTATFKVTGTVASESNVKIPNIRVVMQFDTAYTDAQGKYNVEVMEFPTDQSFLVKYEDADGTANGSFQSKDSTVVFQNPHFVNGDGHWNQGETSKVVDVKLKSSN
jgi:putative lipoprotein (rSAM/lipoprotein system)